MIRVNCAVNKQFGTSGRSCSHRAYNDEASAATCFIGLRRTEEYLGPWAATAMVMLWSAQEFWRRRRPRRARVTTRYCAVGRVPGRRITPTLSSIAICVPNGAESFCRRWRIRCAMAGGAVIGRPR